MYAGDGAAAMPRGKVPGAGYGAAQNACGRSPAVANKRGARRYFGKAGAGIAEAADDVYTK